MKARLFLFDWALKIKGKEWVNCKKSLCWDYSERMKEMYEGYIRSFLKAEGDWIGELKLSQNQIMEL